MPGSPDLNLRATDAEREHCAQTLRWAAGEGALTVEELDERLTAAYAAVHRRDLPQLLVDLPQPPAAPAPPPAKPQPEQPSRFWIWALIPWLASAAWVHATFVTRQTKYASLALVYALPLIVAIIVAPGTDDEIPDWIVAIAIVFWIVGSIQAWMARPAVDEARLARSP